MMIFEYFQSEENLSKLLTDCQPIFDEVEMIQELFRADKIISPDEYAKYLNVLTGHFMYLDRLSAVAEAYQEIKEADFLLEAKNKPLAEGQKAPSDETAKAIAKQKSANYIRLANLLKSYAKITEKAIITIQSQLNRLSDQLKYKTPTQETW
jgi:hypothetical protein